MWWREPEQQLLPTLEMVQLRLSEPPRIVVAAAPSYLARRGAPEKRADLLQHSARSSLARPGEAGESALGLPLQSTHRCATY